MYTRVTNFRTASSLGVVLLLGLLGSAAARAQKPRRGEVFATFSEYDLRTNKPIRLEDFRGRVVLIDFWATWCGPCVREIPNIKKAYKKYHAKGFEIISISLDRNVEFCKAFVEKNEMDWYHIADGRGWDCKLALKHKVGGIPLAVVIGKDGKVISTDAHGEGLTRAIEDGLAQDYKPDTDDEIEKQAKARLAEADQLRDRGRYEEALKIYEEIGLKYAARSTGQLANERVRELRENREVVKQIDEVKSEEYERQARQEGGQWLKVARQMVKSGKPDLARKYYQRILDRYPGSKVAKVAENELTKLPS